MAEEKKLNTLRDELLEAIAGGTLSEYDKQWYSTLINATKDAGESVDYLLAIVDDVYRDKPELHDEICDYIFQNWGLSSSS